jgi:hypothetical protein
MARRAQPPIEEEVPLYIRWSPDQSAYSIELRLDLVTEIAAQVDFSERMGTELGGFLIGSFPIAHMPTIRIDDIHMVSNGSEDDTVFLPEPSEFRRLPDMKHVGRARESAVIGFFRTHARIGPMRPSLADRSIFAHEFRNSPYVVLLIHAQAPHTAAFFVATSGQLPQEPSVREFIFDENEFKALPEIPAEAEEEPTGSSLLRWPIESERLRVYLKIALLVLLAAGACALMWAFAHQSNTSLARGAPNNGIRLAVTPDRNLLRISWNHEAADLNQTTGGTVVVLDGGIRSEVPLEMDDLRLGSIEYQQIGPHVQVELRLNKTNGQVSSESAGWTSQ